MDVCFNALMDRLLRKYQGRVIRNLIVARYVTRDHRRPDRAVFIAEANPYLRSFVLKGSKTVRSLKPHKKLGLWSWITDADADSLTVFKVECRMVPEVAEFCIVVHAHGLWNADQSREDRYFWRRRRSLDRVPHPVGFTYKV